MKNFFKTRNLLRSAMVAAVYGVVTWREFVVVTCIGYPLMKILLKNKKLIDILKFNTDIKYI